MHALKFFRSRLGVCALQFLLLSALHSLHAESSGSSDVWRVLNIGAPPIAGAARTVPCTILAGCPTFAITATGNGIAATADQFSFLARNLIGDGSMTLRVSGLSGGGQASETGIVIRESLAVSSRSAALIVSRSGELTFRRRVAEGALTIESRFATPPTAGWLRLERIGTSIRASVSGDGAQWTSVGSERIPFPTTVFVGASVASRDPVPATATVSEMALIPSATTLPPGWASADVGVASGVGTAFLSDGAILAVSAGTGLGDTADAFRFLYVRVAGDTTLITRVAATTGSAQGVAGVMFRNSLEPSAAHSAVLFGATGVQRVQRTGDAQPATREASSAQSTSVWLKLERRGAQVTASQSPDGSRWTLLGADNSALDSQLYAGLVVAGGAGNLPAAGAFDHLSLIATPANRPPEVAITAPVNGTSIAAGQGVAIAADAFDPDDRVSRVDFFVNGQSIGSDTAAPYEATWTAGAAGAYVLTAVARDDEGGVTTSAPAMITTVADPAASVPAPKTPPVTSPIKKSVRSKRSNPWATPSLNPSAAPIPTTSLDPSAIPRSVPSPIPSMVPMPTSSLDPSASAIPIPTPSLDPSATPTPSSPIAVPTPDIPSAPSVVLPQWRVVFVPSSDDALVDYYALDVTLTSTKTIVLTTYLGKPPISADGTCTADIDSVISVLPAGQYEAVVRAVAVSGSSGSVASPFAK